jgi:hypothetical protein
VDGYSNTGTEEIQMDSSRGVNKPYLTVWTTSLNTLNSVTEASTTLPDGTTVSIRSDGGTTNPGTPVMTVGYNTLTSSTWTSIGTIHADFTKTVDGNNNVEIVSDDAGNFYIIGFKAGTGANLMGQAYKKTGTTTWAAQAPLYQTLGRGNEQTIRSISAVYNPAGQDASDLPGIYGVAVRGSGGNRPDFPYHTSGAGYAHDWTMDPAALLAGSGTLLKMSAVGYGNITESGLPAYGEICYLAPNSFAAYVQRGKIGNTVVGGIQMMGMYQGFGLVNENDREYIATGASELIAVSPDVFAHVYDQEGLKLVVKFYNKRGQVLGGTGILKEAFWGSTIDTKFAAHYDKTANLVRVFYVDASSARNLSRFDVSPVTFSGTTTANVITSIGSASNSVVTNIRISRNADERRVLLECAVNTGGVVSTSGVYSTVGNIAPAAPALVTRPNFDATLQSLFEWKFGDTNPKDTQSAFEIEFSRVSDAVVVYTSGKVTSTTSAVYIPANTLTNGVNYRWRVRTYDVVGATGTWSGYGTFTTAATGTLTITSPAVDNSLIETSTVPVTWTYEQAAGQTQAQRQVKVTRTADNAVVLDTTMQASTVQTYSVPSLESGKEYRVEVTIINSASIQTPTISRLITPNYSQPMTPEAQISQREDHVEIVVVNPVPRGDRPEVTVNDIYKRRTSSKSKATDFKRIATVNNSATYRDFAVKSGVSYDYQIIGRTA